MALTEKTTPYEFLARLTDGKLTGAHVGFRTQILRDGVVVSDVAEPVQSVAVGIKAGFPLADVVGEVCAAALLKVDELTAQLAAANAELAAVRAELAATKEPA
jgi:hypothetical protein